jgi:hypothetical protein
MYKKGWDYPLHLGVTEAGEGEDGRMKSAIGTYSYRDRDRDQKKQGEGRGGQDGGRGGALACIDRELVEGTAWVEGSLGRCLLTVSKSAHLTLFL